MGVHNFKRQPGLGYVSSWPCYSALTLKTRWGFVGVGVEVGGGKDVLIYIYI